MSGDGIFSAGGPETARMDRVIGSFLATLSADERDDLLSRGKPRAYQEGERILVQGELGHHVLLLRYGRDVLLGLRGSGDLLGELGYLSGAPRTATVIAVDPVTAVAVDFTELRG